MAVLTVSLASPVFAIEVGGMGIAPAHPDPSNPISSSWFLYQVDPGQIIQDAAIVQNTSDAPMKIKIDGLDAFSTEDGSFALGDSEATNQDVGTWIKLSTDEVTVPPHSRVEVPFTITVPQDAEVGDHIAGLAVYKDTVVPDQVVQRGGASVGISTRVGARIYLTVKGDVKRNLKIVYKRLLRIGDKLVMRFKFKNDGNIRASLLADTTVYDLFGVYDKQKVDIGQVLPHKTLTRDSVWPGKSGTMIGPFLAHVILTDTNAEAGAAPMKPISLWLPAFFLPLGPIAIILFILFILWLVWRTITWARLAKLARRPVKEHTVKAGDNLYELAALSGIPWKLLAQLNDIKAPYFLVPGSTIYLPDPAGTVSSKLRLPSFFGKIKFGGFKGFAGKVTQELPMVTLVADRGDTLADIAEYAGVTVTQLCALNGIKTARGYRLKAGQELIAPDFDKVSDAKWEKWWEDRNKKPAQTVAPKQPKTPAIIPVTSKTERTVVRHLISVVAEKGDTLADIASYAGITVAELAKLNRIANTRTYKVKAGEEFIIPDPES